MLWPCSPSFGARADVCKSPLPGSAQALSWRSPAALKGLQALVHSVCHVLGAGGPQSFRLRNLCQGSRASRTWLTAVSPSPANLYGKAKGSPARSSHAAARRSPKTSHRDLGRTWCGNKTTFRATTRPLGPPPTSRRIPPCSFTALMPPRSGRQPRPNSDPSAPPRAPSLLDSEGGPAEWEGTSEKDRRNYQWWDGCGRPWWVYALRAAGGVAAAAGGSAGRRPPWRTRSAGPRPLAPAATPSSERSSARRSPPISSMRTSRCGRCAAAPRSQPPGSGGAVEALGSVARRAGWDGRGLFSAPSCNVPKAPGSFGHRRVAGGCRAAGAARPAPAPLPLCHRPVCGGGASGAPRVAAWRHCRPCCRLNCPGTCRGLVVKPEINRLQAISLWVQGVRTQTVHRASRRRASLDVPLESVIEIIQLCLPGFAYEPLRGMIKGKNYRELQLFLLFTTVWNWSACRLQKSVSVVRWGW